MSEAKSCESRSPSRAASRSVQTSPPEVADALAAALAASEPVFELTTEDGTYVLSLGKVVYVRRSERETQIGFAATCVRTARRPPSWASRRGR